jgi:hypothetical protein
VRRASIALVAVVGAAVVPASPAGADLIPPPSAWPVPVTGATNPLAGTAFTFNGGQATANAKLQVWLPVGRDHRKAITRTIGRRTAVGGRLTNRDTRHAINGATVTLAAQVVYGGDWIAVAHVHTDRHGHFRAVLPPGHNRRVAVLYWPAVDSPGPVYSRRLLVRASSRVSLSTRTTGRSVLFRGRVSGDPRSPSGGPAAPIPSGGLLVAIQVRNNRGNWVTARLTRTGNGGRFRVRYRFGSGAFSVRALAPAQTAWPLYGGHSSVRIIRPR